jgi:hypothetical protein
MLHVQTSDMLKLNEHCPTLSPDRHADGCSAFSKQMSEASKIQAPNTIVEQINLAVRKITKRILILMLNCDQGCPFRQPGDARRIVLSFLGLFPTLGRPQRPRPAMPVVLIGGDALHGGQVGSHSPGQQTSPSSTSTMRGATRS